jgi:predicted O-linked N-acetylglucosamine transferase (SPINDLY family)
MPGALMRGRQSAAMLRLVGMDDLVREDTAGYVEQAVAIANDPGLRGTLSERIAAGRGALFERDEPIRELERFLESAIEKARRR